MPNKPKVDYQAVFDENPIDESFKSRRDYYKHLSKLYPEVGVGTWKNHYAKCVQEKDTHSRLGSIDGSDKSIRMRVSPAEYAMLKQLRENPASDISRVLVIGDLHEPFCLNGYLDFCKYVYAKHKCNKVVFIGDIIDNHYSSYHETDADGMGGGDELALAKGKIQKWFKAFPKATVIIGNHDRIIMRKAQTSSIPKAWIREYKDVLEVPTWDFVDRLVIDGVQYIHGEGGTAHTKCRADMMPTVQGHLHTQCYVQWFVGANFKVFGMQVGCGIDHDSYAMAYAKRGKKPAIGCGVVLGGNTAINEMMDL